MMVAYIDAEYYNNEYKGVDAGDDLDRYIERASDLVDQVTGYKIRDFEALPPFIQEQVKKATAAQVEFYVLNGGPEGVDGNDGGFNQVAIGSFEYQTARMGQQTPAGKQEHRVAPAALAYLEPTGLLYRGVRVYGG